MAFVYFISGIGPDTSGTGRLMQGLLAEKAAINNASAKFLFQYRKTVPIKKALKEKKYGAALKEMWSRAKNGLFWSQLFFLSTFTKAPLVFFHPQSLTTKRAWKILHAWRGPIFYFVLDESVFCIRSYNHVFGDNEACTACIGGNTKNIAKRGCEPFPLPDAFFQAYVENLYDFAKTADITFLTQSTTQTELLSQHFPAEKIKTVGLWTADWDELGYELEDVDEFVNPDPEYEWDVIYHGYFVSGKGADWLYAVAKHAPDVKFLFSCGRHTRVPLPVLPNVKFQYMTWATGLRDSMKKAKITMTPSLWSAPIEGALIKSILLSPMTGVVDVESAYSHILPDDLVHKFSQDPAQAAKQIIEVLQAGKGPSKKRRHDWWQEFVKTNRPILRHILAAVENDK